MTEIKHRGVNIRVVDIKKQTWIVMADVAKAERMGNHSELKRRLPDECTRLYKVHDRKGRLQEMLLINLEGLYILIGDSLIDKLAKRENLKEQIIQKNDLQKHQMRSLVKELLEIWG